MAEYNPPDTTVDVVNPDPPPNAHCFAEPADIALPLIAYDFAECSVPSTASASTAQDFAEPDPAVSVTPAPPIAHALDEYCELSTCPSVLFE